MLLDLAIGFFVHLAVTVVVPLGMAGFRRLFPDQAMFAPASAESALLRKRNNWIDQVAGGFCIVGLFSGVVLYATVLDDKDPWGLGFAFGMAVVAPLVWITAVTLPDGKWRLAEFWVFYSAKYGLSWK